MAPKVPFGYASVLEAHTRRDGGVYDILGVCTDYLTPAPSRGSDMTMKLTLWDATCIDSTDPFFSGVVIRLFAKDLWQFPRIEEMGDIVILRRIRTKCQGSQWFGLSTHDTKWSVISAHDLLEAPSVQDVQQQRPYEGHSAFECRQGSTLTLADLTYAKSLLQLKDPNTLRGPPRSTALDVAAIMTANGGKPPPKKDKFRLLRDLPDPRTHEIKQLFVDLIGEVRRVYLGNNPVEIKLTDYTENPLLYDYKQPDSDGASAGSGPDFQHWGGPWGQRTISLCAWDEQADHIRSLAAEGQITLGMYLRAKNVKLDMDKNGGTIQGHMRGNVGVTGTNLIFFTRKDNEEKNGVDQNVEAFLKHRSEYLNEHKLKSLGYKETESISKKRSAPEEDEPDSPEPKKGPGKNAKKRQREKARKARILQQQNQYTSNQHVRCEAIEVPISKITDILDTAQLARKTVKGNSYNLPFQNCKYKSKVFVVDFFPDKLEDFTTPWHQAELDSVSDNEEETHPISSYDISRYKSAQTRWKWHFCLVVRDASNNNTKTEESETMVLQVIDQDADYLLNMEACDLRTNRQAFAKMKEKLFVLWGDLEEKKKEAGKDGCMLREEGVSISSKPFECMIKEYGVNARDDTGRIMPNEWIRTFGLFKTNIG